MNNYYYLKRDHDFIFRVDYVDGDSDTVWGVKYHQFQKVRGSIFTGYKDNYYLGDWVMLEDLENEPIPEEIRILLEL